MQILGSDLLQAAFVSTPNKPTANTASVIGSAPSSAIVAMEGEVTAATTSAMIRTPPALLAPAASPVPRERTRVGCDCRSLVLQP